MIDEYSIERKDFSVALPRTIAKLRAISYLLEQDNFYRGDFGSSESDVMGIVAIMEDVADDLQVIKEALYGEAEKEAPETKTSQEDGQGLDG